jgi:ribonuclease/clavin/mitogillin
LDTGEGIPEYIPLLQTALDKDHEGATISKVICSHWHHDHVGGVQDVLSFLAARNIRLHDPLVNVEKNVHSAPAPALAPGVFKYLSLEHDDPETRFQAIKDQDEIRIDDQTTLVTLHTPGHTSDHCSFYLKEENTLFTADCVLGQGTAVFEDLSAYIKSLERQLTVGGPSPSYKIYPGHGPVIEDGPAKIREYIKHRLDREKQILTVLQTPTNNASPPPSNVSPSSAAASNTGTKTAMEIVAVIYEAYPVSLHAAAEHQVLLHLKKLEREGKVHRSSAEEISDAAWTTTVTQASL